MRSGLLIGPGLRAKVIDEDITTKPTTPLQSSVTRVDPIDGDETRLRVFFSAVAGATSYRVEQYNILANDWVSSVTGAGSPLEATGLDAGERYDFRVIPINGDATPPLEGPPSVPVEGVVYQEPAAPSGLVLEPVDGSTFAAASFVMRWGEPVDSPFEWWVRAGSAVGLSDYFDSGRITVASTRSVTLSGLPTSGETIYLRLLRKTPGGWVSEDSVHTAATLAGVSITEPTWSIDNSDSAAITATVEFYGRDASNFQVDTTAETRWGPAGVDPLPYVHTSPGAFAGHAQVLPAGAPNVGDNGPYLTPGTTYDAESTVTAGGDSASSGRYQIIVPELTPEVSEMTFSLNTSDESDIRALIQYSALGPTGAAVLSAARFDWGEAGSARPYAHISPGEFLNHEQLIPTNPVNVGDSGPPLQRGQSYEGVATVTVDGVDYSSDVLEFDVPVAGSSGGATGGGGGGTGTNGNWSNLRSPPTLSLSGLKSFTSLSDFDQRTISGDGFHCEGPYLSASGSTNQDAFIDLSKMGEIRVPVIVRDFRNVIMIAGEHNVYTRPGCDIGDKKFFYTGDGQSRPNSHPVFPWNRQIGVWCTHDFWIEGADVDLRGHMGDAIVRNVPTSYSRTAGEATARSFLINSRFAGIEGNKGPNNIGMHGDVYQNQQLDRPQRSFFVENVTSLTSYSHMSLGQNSPWYEIEVRNWYADIDPTYGSDQTTSGGQDYRPDYNPGPIMYARCDTMSRVKATNVVYRGENLNEYHQTALQIKIADGSQVFTRADKYIDGRSTGFGSGPFQSELRKVPGDHNTYLTNGFPPPVAAYDMAPKNLVGQNYISPWASQYEQYR